MKPYAEDPYTHKWVGVGATPVPTQFCMRHKQALQTRSALSVKGRGILVAEHASQ